MNLPDGHPVIVFDGVCALCNGWVRFLLKRDRRQRYRFAAMQTEAGRGLLQANGLDADDPMSFLLLDEMGGRIDSDAIIAVLVGLGGAWRMATLCRLLPRMLRDPPYRWLARNRYRWFGRKQACFLPDTTQRHRFIDL